MTYDANAFAGPMPGKIPISDEVGRCNQRLCKIGQVFGGTNGELPKDQYEKLRTEAEAARTLTERLRHDLDLHTTRHGC